MEVVPTCLRMILVGASRGRHKAQETSLCHSGLLPCLETSPCFVAVVVGPAVSMV